MPNIPVIATGKVFSDYLTAARTNLENCHKLALALKDTEFAEAVQRIIDGFDGDAADARFLIEEANPGRPAMSYLPQVTL